MILVTGGAGFIGSNFILDWLEASDEPVVNLDRLTYAGNLGSLAALDGDPRHVFVLGDIGDSGLLGHILMEHQPRAILHFAAESHVDRSIHGPAAFIQTNVVGTFSILDTARSYFESLPSEQREQFRFLHVSTDEVYGSLGKDAVPFTEATAYAPNSPYSASKAASDHLVRAYHHTYGLPTLTTNCSNNYGPYQFPEKLIPLMILNAIRGQALPVYGDGMNVRDWLYVKDHCAALRVVLEGGAPGEVYNIGGSNERTNLDVVHAICGILEEFRPPSAYTDLITFVKDRPGHDRRYAIDARKIEHSLGWRPSETFQSGLRKTVSWYLDNAEWVKNVSSGNYRKWISEHYGAGEAT